MRRYVTVVFLASLTVLMASPAGAAPPVRDTTSFELADEIPAVVCGFPLRFQIRGTLTTTIFVDADGNAIRGIVTGPATVTFTNLVTGSSRTFAIPGPSFLDANALVRGTGPWFASDADGHPVIAAGNWVFEAGVPVGVGRVLDVCDALA